MKIKLGPERMNVNVKEAEVMPTVLHLVSKYNAEAAKAHTKAREDIDFRLKQALANIEAEYEEKLLGIFDK